MLFFFGAMSLDSNIWETPTVTDRKPTRSSAESVFFKVFFKYSLEKHPIEKKLYYQTISIYYKKNLMYDLKSFYDFFKDKLKDLLNSIQIWFMVK